MVDIKNRLADGWFRCNVLIELVGKPKEHIEKTMQGYVEKIMKEEDMEVIESSIAELKEFETGAKEEGMVKDMWSTFSELDIMIKNMPALTQLCLNYMPASVEIIEPEKITYTREDLSIFFNDLQARLHQLDLIAKQMKSEAMFLRKGVSALLGNFIRVLLSRQVLDLKQLCGLTGANEKIIGDFMDKMTDDGKVVLEDGKYRWVDENAQ